MAEPGGALHAPDKLAFLLSLVPYLMDRERVSVAEAAAHFGVPRRRDPRAVELIAVSGVPGETTQYQHGDLFDIAWDDFEQNDVIVLTNLVAIDDSPRFSAREAAALIAGLQYLPSLPENADRAAIATPDGEARPRGVRRAEPGRGRPVRDERAPRARRTGGRGRRPARVRLRGSAVRRRAPPGRPAAGRVGRRRLVPPGLGPPARGAPHVPPRPHRRTGAHHDARSRTGPPTSPCPRPCSRAPPTTSSWSLEIDAAPSPLLADYVPDEPERPRRTAAATPLRVNQLRPLNRLVAGSRVAPGRRARSARAAVATGPSADLGGTTPTRAAPLTSGSTALWIVCAAPVADDPAR